jgi:uroporphyrinogen-III synthase
LKVKNILVSQPQPVEIEKSPYADLIKKHNVHLDFHKFFRIEGISTREFRDEKIYINEFTAVVFNSKHAIDHFFHMAKEVRIEVPETMKYFCMSESVALYLQKYVQYRKRKIFHADQDISQLFDLIKKHKTENFLLTCSDNGNKELSSILEAAKISYSEAKLYRTVPNDMKDMIDIRLFEMLVFFSPQGIRSLFHNWPDFIQNETLIAAFGTTTAKAAAEAGLKVDIVAPTAVAPSMTMAIDQFLTKNNKK